MTVQRPQTTQSSMRYLATGTIGAVALTGLIAGPAAGHTGTTPAVSTSATFGANALATSTKVQPQSIPASRTLGNIPLPASPAPSLTHVVSAGETLSGIASKYKTSVSAIAEANKLSNVNFIRVGQRLVIKSAAASAPSQKPAPATPSSPSKPASPSAATHTVKAGDTLWALAAQYGTSVAELIKINSLPSSGLIFVGQKLKLSATTTTPALSNRAPSNPAPVTKPVASTPKPTAPAKAAVSNSITYTVKAGDTISKIAAAHGSSTSAIATANKLANVNFIRVGQRLVIPSASASAPAKPAASDDATTPSSPSGAAPGKTEERLVGDTFLHYTYPEHVVAAANENKRALLASPLPSRDQMQALVVSTARAMGVDPALAQAIAFTESSFNHASVSPANAIGTMQVIPSSGEWASQLVGRKLNLLNPQDNATAGIAIIRQLLKSMPTLDEAIASYYQGMGSVTRYGMFEDTENYVATVKSHMTRYQ